VTRAATPPLEARMEAVAELLGAGPASIAELADATGTAYHAAWSAIRRLEHDGRVEADQRGKYRLIA
jgi:predicted transcriptional regulator